MLAAGRRTERSFYGGIRTTLPLFKAPREWRDLRETVAAWASVETGPCEPQSQTTARVLQPGSLGGGQLSPAEPPATTETC